MPSVFRQCLHLHVNNEPNCRESPPAIFFTKLKNGCSDVFNRHLPHVVGGVSRAVGPSTTREERKSDISEISFVSFNFVTQKTTSSIDRDGGSGGLIYFC